MPPSRGPLSDCNNLLPYPKLYILFVSLALSPLLGRVSARAQLYGGGGGGTGGGGGGGAGGDDSYSYYYNYNGNGNSAGEYLSDWSQNEWGKISGRSLQSKCVDIPSNLTLCHDIGYTRMLLPNILDHDSLNEVTQQAGSWVPLVNINCHPDAKVFLCSLFSPVCLERLIYPCRSLCEGVQASCVDRMKAYGFDWPDMLKCDKFPLDNDMCIKLIHDVKPDNNCTACKHPLTHEAMIDHFCRSDVAVRVNIKEFRNHLGNKELILQNKKTFYKDTAGISKSPRQPVAVIEGGASCTCNTVNSTKERYLLMGNKRDDKIIVKFGMPWNKNNKEFKKGFKAIRKGNTCEGIFRELVANGVETKAPSAAAGSAPGGKEAGKKNGKNNKNGKKGGKKDNKNGKKENKPKKNNKKGKKDKEKEKDKEKVKEKDKEKVKEKDKKGKKGGGKDKGKANSASRRETVSKSELEDRALNNFMKVAN